MTESSRGPASSSLSFADTITLIVLAATWGASFMFMRQAVPEFGPFALIFVRVFTAAAVLLPIMWKRQNFAGLRHHAGAIFIVGALNSALPFLLFAYAMLSVSSGMAAILSTTTSFWGAILAHYWLKERLNLNRVLGLVMGFSGVVMLVWDKATLKPGSDGLAVVAILIATMLYGFAVNFTKKYLSEVPPLSITASSQACASIVLLPFAMAFWPDNMPSAVAWGNAFALGILCTGFTLVLFFSLLMRIGPSRSISMAFMIPAFGTLWGILFLNESLTANMLFGGITIFIGMALTTGLLRIRR